MVAVPPVVTTPVTTPVVEPTVAFAVFELVHVPTSVVSDEVVVNPEHTVSVPNIPDGNGFTVTTAVV